MPRVRLVLTDNAALAVGQWVRSPPQKRACRAATTVVSACRHGDRLKQVPVTRPGAGEGKWPSLPHQPWSRHVYQYLSKFSLQLIRSSGTMSRCCVKMLRMRIMAKIMIVVLSRRAAA